MSAYLSCEGSGTSKWWLKLCLLFMSLYEGIQKGGEGRGGEGKRKGKKDGMKGGNKTENELKD